MSEDLLPAPTVLKRHQSLGPVPSYEESSSTGELHEEEEEEKAREAHRRICFLICPGCNYLEFPGCSSHKVLFSKLYKDGAGNVAHVGCENCHYHTNNAFPFKRACRSCNKVKAKAAAWITSKAAIARQAAWMASQAALRKEVGLVVCSACHKADFPEEKDELMGVRDGRLYDERASLVRDVAYFKLTHLHENCEGRWEVIPVMLSQEESEYVRDHFAATQPIPLAEWRGKKDKRFTLLPQYRKDLLGARLLLTSRYSDVTFFVGPSRVAFPAHRLLMAARSPVFAAMLYAGFAESAEGTVTLTDMEPAIFAEIIKLIYTDEVSITPQNVYPLLFASALYQIEALRVQCIRFLLSGVDESSACDVLEASPGLMEEERYALRFIEDNANKVLASPAFRKLSPQAVKKVVESEKLSCGEVMVFKAVIAWAITQLARKQAQGDHKPPSVEPSGTEERGTKSAHPPADTNSGLQLVHLSDARLKEGWPKRRVYRPLDGDKYRPGTREEESKEEKEGKASDASSGDQQQQRQQQPSEEEAATSLIGRTILRVKRSFRNKVLPKGESDSSRPAPPAAIASKTPEAKLEAPPMPAEVPFVDPVSNAAIDLTRLSSREEMDELLQLATPDLAALREVVKDLIPAIRFPLLSLHQLAALVAPTGVVETPHLLSLFMYANEVANQGPSKAKFPDDLPYSRKHRQPRATLLQYERDYDENGFFYHIATNGKTEAWQNPAISGRIGITAQASSTNGPLTSVLQHSAPSDNFYITNGNPNSITFDLKGNEIAPTHFTLRHNSSHNSGYFCRNWRIEGSRDGKTWDTISSHADDDAITVGSKLTHTWRITPPCRTFYTFIRYVQTGPTSSSGAEYSMTNGLELYGRARFVR